MEDVDALRLNNNDFYKRHIVANNDIKLKVVLRELNVSIVPYSSFI